MTTHLTTGNRTARRLATTIGALTLAGASVAGIGLQLASAATSASAEPIVTTETKQPRSDGPEVRPDRDTSSDVDVIADDPTGRRITPTLHRGDHEQTSGPTQWRSMADFMTFVIQDVDGYWTRELKRGGFAEPQVTYTFPRPNQRVRNCESDQGGYSTDRTAVYCPGTDHIFISQQMAVDLWNGVYSKVGKGGDFAVATVIAHEMAHNIQNELGYFRAVGYDSAHATRAIELGADCLAGLWTRDAGKRGLLDPGDVEEGAHLAFSVGDFDTDEVGHHGTPDQREAAFRAGFRGSFASCKAIMEA